MNLLEAKILGHNRLNAEINRLLPLFRANFTPLIGSKIINNDGSIAKKISQAIPEIGENFRMYKAESGYHLSFKIYLDVNYQKRGCESSFRAESNIHVCNLDYGVLKDMPEHYFSPRPENYSIEKVFEARKEIELAKRAMSEAQNKVFPFGEYD